jgi:hypothetical protein
MAAEVFQAMLNAAYHGEPVRAGRLLGHLNSTGFRVKQLAGVGGYRLVDTRAPRAGGRR